MKKSDTEQEQPGLEENKVPDSQSKRELDRELQELAEKEHQEEIYYEERRRERHERNLKRKKRQIRNRNLALIITALAVLGGVGYFYREQTGLKDGMETLVAKVRDLVPDKNSGKESKAAEELAKADGTISMDFLWATDTEAALSDFSGQCFYRAHRTPDDPADGKTEEER